MVTQLKPEVIANEIRKKEKRKKREFIEFLIIKTCNDNN